MKSLKTLDIGQSTQLSYLLFIPVFIYLHGKSKLTVLFALVVIRTILRTSIAAHLLIWCCCFLNIVSPRHLVRVCSSITAHHEDSLVPKAAYPAALERSMRGVC